jgi:hypothetical protein
MPTKHRHDFIGIIVTGGASAWDMAVRDQLSLEADVILVESRELSDHTSRLKKELCILRSTQPDNIGVGLAEFIASPIKANNDISRHNFFLL